MEFNCLYGILPLEHANFTEVNSNNDIGDSIEHKLYIAGIRSTREMGIDLFFFILVQLLKS